MQIDYHVVDVFTQTPLEGNPLAVFPDASTLPEDALQRIARELNLSETAFVLPPTRTDCAIRVRIFTPAYEMMFAGHPTIGTAYVARQAGLISPELSEFRLEEKIGPVAVRVDAERRSAHMAANTADYKGAFSRARRMCRRDWPGPGRSGAGCPMRDLQCG